MKSPEERIIEDCIKIPPDYTFYTELGKDFFRFIDKVTGRLYQIKVSEVKPRKIK